MEKTKQYSLLQLFSLVDGRLSTSMDNIYDMLGHISGDDHITTIGLVMVQDQLKADKPEWWARVEGDLMIAEAGAKTHDFLPLITYIKDHYNPVYDIPQS